jgi:hypothetical protein
MLFRMIEMLFGLYVLNSKKNISYFISLRITK